VRDDAPVQTFSDLQGSSSWAYNDVCSLSGYYGLLNKLAELGTDESFFGNVSCSGSHLNSIEAVLRGEVDSAAIDSNVLRIRLREAGLLSEAARDRILGPVPDTVDRGQLQAPPRTERPTAPCLLHHKRGRGHAPSPATIRPQPLRRREPGGLFPRRVQRPCSTARGQVVMPGQGEGQRYRALAYIFRYPWIPAPRFRGDKLRGNDG
jgi:hypothetical protein